MIQDFPFQYRVKDNSKLKRLLEKCLKLGK